MGQDESSVVVRVLPMSETFVRLYRVENREDTYISLDGTKVYKWESDTQCRMWSLATPWEWSTRSEEGLTYV